MTGKTPKGMFSSRSTGTVVLQNIKIMHTSELSDTRCQIISRLAAYEDKNSRAATTKSTDPIACMRNSPNLWEKKCKKNVLRKKVSIREDDTA